MTKRSLTDLAQRVLGTPPPPPRPALRVRPGIYCGWGSNGPVHAGPEHHVLVLGPPRSGKTTRVVVPAVICHPGPAVVTSTKPDLIHATLAHRRGMGPCWYWDPSGTTTPPEGTKLLRWSPVAGCERWDTAVARTHALASAARPQAHASDAHWLERAQALLAPLLHAAALSEGGLDDVLSWLHRHELQDALTVLDNSGARRASDILHGVGATDPRELSGIYSTADSILGAYRTDAAVTATRSPNFNAEEFATSRGTIYLTAPAADQQLHAPIVIALLDKIKRAVFRRHPNPPMLYALDEVANIAPLPDLPGILAEGGSQGLIVLACLQDLSQARSRWPAAADGMLTLFTQKLCLPGIADMATLKAISTLAGYVDQPVRSTTTARGRRPQRGTTWTIRRRPRLPPDAIAHCQQGTAILVAGTHLLQVLLPAVRDVQTTG